MKFDVIMFSDVCCLLGNESAPRIKTTHEHKHQEGE